MSSPIRTLTVPPPSRVWRLLAAFGWMLAIGAAAGATSPRPRTAQRDRGGRATILRAGSPRANERQGWVMPDPAGSGIGAATDDIESRRPGLRVPLSVVAVQRVPAFRPAASPLAVLEPAPAPVAGAVRPDPGRGPPAA
ncbi:MAG: hypothetical protein R2708_18030 [Vicinamibacterales bacterium]